MIQKITKKLVASLLVLALLTTNLLTFAAPPMKDIELDPDKISNVGNMLQVFPTIASNLVTVDFFFESDGVVAMQVFDLQGRLMDGVQGFVPKARTHETTWDVNGVSNGTYFVKLSHANGTILTSKVIVRH